MRRLAHYSWRDFLLSGAHMIDYAVILDGVAGFTVHGSTSRIASHSFRRTGSDAYERTRRDAQRLGNTLTIAPVHTLNRVATQSAIVSKCCWTLAGDAESL